MCIRDSIYTIVTPQPPIWGAFHLQDFLSPPEGGVTHYILMTFPSLRSREGEKKGVSTLILISDFQFFLIIFCLINNLISWHITTKINQLKRPMKKKIYIMI